MIPCLFSVFTCPISKSALLYIVWVSSVPCVPAVVLRTSLLCTIFHFCISFTSLILVFAHARSSCFLLPLVLVFLYFRFRTSLLLLTIAECLAFGSSQVFATCNILSILYLPHWQVYDYLQVWNHWIFLARDHGFEHLSEWQNWIFLRRLWEPVQPLLWRQKSDILWWEGLQWRYPPMLVTTKKVLLKQNMLFSSPSLGVFCA